ncbi:hypothetical protein BN1708_002726 [Verticillium longisporum]|uniref:Uncharacterized protein n=1 Tax=Verticillium longisporum TaxID=100787 RepID=A0A0G4L0B8_VERLO|nr:hypothetical protein BN1708_002726 [Verticillium longisporum]
MIEGKEMAPFIAANGQRPGWKRGSPPSNIRVPPPAAPPAAPPAVLPDFSSQPVPRPNLPINDQAPEQPIAAPIEAPTTPPITVTAPPEIRTITAAPPAGTVTASLSTSSFSSTSSLSITTQPPALPVFDPTAPRKELEPPSPTTSKSRDDTTTSSTSSSNLITGTALPVEENDSASGRGRMDPNTEHALIAVGSIGSFIFASFIIWIVWRTVRRTRKKRRERESQFPNLGQGPPPPINKPSIGIRFAAKIPFLRNIAAARGWHNLDDGAGQPPPYEKGGRGSLRLDTDSMIEGKEMAPFIAANGQRPGWKRGSPPSNIRVPARRIRQRVDVADGGGNSSDDEAGPVHNKNRRQVPATKTRDIISTRDDDLPTPVPDFGLTNDAVADGSDSDSGPDSPTSPTSPINSPVASAPPPAAAQPPVTLTPIKPPGPRPSPPPPAAPPSPTTTPPVALPPAAPPAAPPAVLPDFSSQPRVDVADGGGNSSDDEAGPVHNKNRRQVPATKTRDIISTRNDDLPTPVPDFGLTNDAVADGSDSDSGPDSPTSPTSPINSPVASAPPPAAAQPPVTLTPIKPPGPRPSPPPPAAPPSPTTTPPVALPPAAPPAAPPAVLPDFSSQPVPRPNLPINDQAPEQPIATPIEAPTTPPITVTAPPEIRTITAAPPAGTVTASLSTSNFSSTSSLSITTQPPALPMFDPTAPRKELEPPSPTTSKSRDDSTTSSTSSSNLITGTALPVEDNDSASGRGRMDPNTEHALIAVGSIGSFIFASFIIWIVWRTVRRTRKKRRERESQFPNLGQGPPPPINKPGIGIRFAAKVPFLRNIAAARGWHNLDDGAGQPPPYEKGGRGSLRLDTDVYAGQPKFQQPSSATYSLPQTSANGTPITVSPTSMALQRNDTLRAQQGTYRSGDGTIDSIMSRYGNGGDMSSTLQSAGGGLYYVGSEMEIARQQTNGYGRPANRVSAISSLSSGFGDGDIIVPGLQPPPPASQALRSTQNVVGRYSWVSKSGSSNRETIYTETSEDLPPRFRTVNSWVNQQTGRVKRAQGRSDDEEDVPPVPGLPAALGKNIMPPEQQFNMMMPDGEEPRRPDDYQLR